MNRLNPQVSIILVLTILFAVMLSCNFNQTEEQTTLFDQYYTIEPISLMDLLKSGDMNAFTPVSEAPELLPMDQLLPVNWVQTDYFYIANTLYDGVIGKSLQGWQLKGMDFGLGCIHVHNGFQNGRFEFFRMVKEKEQESRIIRFIDIDPRGNFVHVKEWEFYPNLVNLEAIGLAQLKISADLALQIAENNGGKEKRQAVGDACDISLGLFPNSADYGGWVVIYTRSDDHTSLLHIKIDPITGEIHFP